MRRALVLWMVVLAGCAAPRANTVGPIDAPHTPTDVVARPVDAGAGGAEATREANGSETSFGSDEHAERIDGALAKPAPPPAEAPKRERLREREEGGESKSFAGPLDGASADVDAGRGGLGGGGSGAGIGSAGGVGSAKAGPPRGGAVVPSGPAAPRPIEDAPAIKAGRHDDNAQYNRFLQFLRENTDAVVYPVDIAERVVVRAVDKDGKSLHGCAVEVLGGGAVLARGTTHADGRTHFFPTDAPSEAYTIKAQCAGQSRTTQTQRRGLREVEVRFPTARAVPARVPVDIAIVFDTTGSMQNQIDRLKATLRAIHLQLANLPNDPDVRFALVDYKDREDEYVTRVTPFTRDLEAFQRVVDAMMADGGGDTPEDLQAALDDAMHKLTWRKEAVRMGFVIADAIPHTDYGQKFDYRAAMREAAERGIKWTTIGAGGLPREGEVIFRQIAQFTMGEYVFITEGGGGDSAGGVGEASHHVGSNYKAENLDQAMVRIVRRELSHLTDSPSDFDYTIVARADTRDVREQALNEAVREALRQLVDYSAMRLEERVPVAVAPIAADRSMAELAEYMTQQLQLATSREARLRLIERDLAAVSQELKIQLSDLVDVKEAVPIGKMVGAEVLIVGKLVRRGAKAELFAKLVRVETGEILSVAKVALGDTLVNRT